VVRSCTSAGEPAQMSMIWLVTGPPGVGKSTLVSRVVLKLKSAGVIVGGCMTSEVRTGGARTGFSIKDLGSGRVGVLASVGTRLGPKVGRYRVDLSDLAGIGAAGVDAAAEGSEVVVIDEVGPMELVSPEFRRAVTKAMGSGKPVLAVVHERLEDDIIMELRSSAEEIFELTVEGRDQAGDRIFEVLLKAAGGPKV
jgi:nucleoside-triphosphatase